MKQRLIILPMTDPDSIHADDDTHSSDRVRSINTDGYIIYLYHTHSNIWYTCNKIGNTKNTIRILK